MSTLIGNKTRKTYGVELGIHAKNLQRWLRQRDTEQRNIK